MTSPKEQLREEIFELVERFRKAWTEEGDEYYNENLTDDLLDLITQYGLSERIGEIARQNDILFSHEPYFTNVSNVMIYNKNRKAELEAQLTQKKENNHE